MIIEESYGFDDLLLVPKYSDVASRANVDLSVAAAKDFRFNIPLVPSNMQTITEIAMASIFYNFGGMAIFHRFCNFEQQLNWLEVIKIWHNGTRHIGFSVGVKEEDYSKVDVLIAQGAEIILIDIAHGHSAHCIAMTKYIAEKYPNVLLISGNVATRKGTYDLFMSGADIVKCNVGSGSLCSTRTTTGCGVPALSTLMDCDEGRMDARNWLARPLCLMQDGGATNSGNVSKSLVYADFYMGGNLYSATEETPGEIIEKDGEKYKKYVGSSTHKETRKEGVETLQKYKGSVSPIINQILEGIASCCSYNGVHNLVNIKKHPEWRKVSSAGHKESIPHTYGIQL